VPKQTFDESPVKQDQVQDIENPETVPVPSEVNDYNDHQTTENAVINMNQMQVLEKTRNS